MGGRQRGSNDRHGRGGGGVMRDTWGVRHGGGGRHRGSNETHIGWSDERHRGGSTERHRGGGGGVMADTVCGDWGNDRHSGRELG